MSGIIRQISQAITAIPGLHDARSRRFVLLCGILCAVAAGGWAFMFPGNWQASQSLVVRDDLLGDSFKPGRFNSLESMKSAQETIFHIARKPEVIRAAVHECGQTTELSSESIEKYQRWISIGAPNGGEFGKTEVFVLQVREKSPEQAELLINALSNEIERHARVVRTNLMASMQNELTSNVARTSGHYNELVSEIQKVERSVGPDLASLRGLIDPNSGAGDLQRSLEQIRLEIRAAQNDRERVAKQLELVRLAMQQSSGDYLTTSNDLLELQPALKRLNDGLVDARLALSVAMGKYDSGHPLVENAKTAAGQTLEQIRMVLGSTELGLESQLGLYEQKVARLSSDEQKSENRLIEIGKLRVNYKSLSDELTKRGEALAKTRTELAEIQALAESAGDVNLITRIGEPQMGTRPDGISKRAMILAGFLGGMISGLGLVVLNAGPVLLPALSMFNMAAKNTLPQSPGVSDIQAETKKSPTRTNSQSPKPVAKVESASADQLKSTDAAFQIQNLEPERSRQQSAVATPQPPAVPPDLMVPNPSGRPGQFLKSIDLDDYDARQTARVETAESIARSGDLTSSEIGKLIPPASGSVVRESARNSPHVPEGKIDSSSMTNRSSDNKTVVRSTSAGEDSTGSEMGHRNTVSLADLQILNLRQQLMELDPTTALDVFCEPVRKEIPTQGEDS